MNQFIKFSVRVSCLARLLLVISFPLIAGESDKDYATWVQVAQTGDPNGQNGLGSCYRDGTGVEKDLKQAVEWFRKAADQNFAVAQTNLGRCYYNGQGVVKDEAEAAKWLRKAAEQGFAEAQTNLGFCYYNGQGVVRDEAEALHWYRKAAEQGDAKGQIGLGLSYENGTGVVKDEAEAMKWYRKAAEQGLADAQYNLGCAYANHTGWCEDQSEAAKSFRKALKQGAFAFPIYQIEAAKWFREAAEQGLAGAQYSLGECYAKGEGVVEDDSEAAKWYRKAAEQGLAGAQYNLGFAYANGQGVLKDEAEAAKWYRKAAEQGSEQAQRHLRALVSPDTFALTVVSDPAASTGFALIPSGAFTMGNSVAADTEPIARDSLLERIFRHYNSVAGRNSVAADTDPTAPTPTVTVSAFYMAKNLVTKAQWDTVRTWGLANGYSDLTAGAGKARNHPVQKISWFQIVKWCNARSQQEGLTPVYYTDIAHTTVYKTGVVNLTNAQVNWAANGYRLPTEAEWEKAARGGLSGKRFPWGDTISHSQANYHASTSFGYDLSAAVSNYHPTYATGATPYTSPVGSFAANGYGLNDMAGNVSQWCWDWYGTYDTGAPTDPRGVSSGTQRVNRGCSWREVGSDCRVARRASNVPSFRFYDLGFRVARSSGPVMPLSIIEQPVSATISSGSAATLSVMASGPAPLRYQWYEGAVGTTATPVGTNSSSYTTPSLIETTTYWARVSNAAEIVDSSLATITIAPAAPTGFALIPSGAFIMGNSVAADTDPTAPAPTVTVSAFYMAKNLVTKAQWDTVRTWGLANGYSDLTAGAGKARNHPVQKISWFQIVKWCNARSQQEGLTPVYYTDIAHTTVYKTGDVKVTNAQVNWAANGYRLPTEAEWEKAARGGLSGKRFPWGDTISHTQANYCESTSSNIDGTIVVNNFHPTYNTGGAPYTSPVGSFAANGYGLTDMAGNVSQWCWDCYGTYDTGAPTDPRGVSSGRQRVYRGGSWREMGSDCSVANRFDGNPSNSGNNVGFRVARSSVQ